MLISAFCRLIVISVLVLIEIWIHNNVFLKLFAEYPSSLSIYVFIPFQYFTFATTLMNYIFAAFMDPGYLTDKMYKKIIDDPFYVEQVDDNGEKSHCFICNKDRPLRCFHCKKCKKCVLVFDHHDKFLFNCVGHRNYKCYYGFLMTSTLCTISTLICNLIKLFSFSSEDKFPLLVLFFLCGLILVYMIPTLYLQTHLLLKNTTLHEVSINRMEQTIYQRHHRRFLNKYDTGNISGNIRFRFGPLPLLWFIPTPNEGKGYIPFVSPIFVAPYEFTSHDNYEEDNIRRRN